MSSQEQNDRHIIWSDISLDLDDWRESLEELYTVEGNSGDSCRVNQYSVGHYEILGYGVPNY